MNKSDSMSMLLHYSAWANSVLYRALGGVRREMLTQPRPGRAQGMAGILGHIYVVGLIWKAHLSDGTHGFTSRNLDSVPTLEDMHRRQQALDQWYIEFSEKLPAAQRHIVVPFRFVDGGRGEMTADQMLLHVVNHGTYHRGYLADMLYDCEMKPPTMDLPVFIRDYWTTSS